MVIKYKDRLSAERYQLHRNFSAEVINSIEALNIDIVKVDPSRFDTTSRRFVADPKVEYVEPDYTASTSVLSSDPAILQNIQWGLYKIEAASSGVSAWNLVNDLQNVKVAVIDTGIDTSHEDLKDAVIEVKNCTNSSTADDLYGHGTHVAGIIAAKADNGVGVAGVARNAQLISGKALGDDGSGFYSWIADCIIWSADHGAKVINMSLGGPSYSDMLRQAIEYAYNKGVLVVAAAGNANTSTPSYPASFPHVLAVGATDTNDNKASFSNWGSWVHVSAPGVSIYSTLPTYNNALKQTRYGYLSGTSMATPFVSGLGALLFGGKDMTVDKVFQLITEKSDKINTTGVNWQYGRINTFKSLSSVVFTQVPTLVPVAIVSPAITPSLTPTSTPIPTITATPTPKPITIPTPTTKAISPWKLICMRYFRYCR